jgi:hypothetical protein
MCTQGWSAMEMVQQACCLAYSEGRPRTGDAFQGTALLCTAFAALLVALHCTVKRLLCHPVLCLLCLVVL